MNIEKAKSELTPNSVAMTIERRTKINGSERGQNIALIEALIEQEVKKRTKADDERCESSPLDAVVILLRQLRSEWSKDRDENTYGSPQWLGKHQGVYALDEAIKTIKAGKLKRYKDENIELP